MSFIDDIHPLSEFKKNASKLIKQVQTTGRPMVLTVNGKPAVVLQDPVTYKNATKDAEYWTTVAALKEAFTDWDNRHTWKTHDEAFESIRSEMAEKYRNK